MAAKFDDDKQDRLSKLLKDPFSNNRDDIWLWLYLRYQHKFELPDESCNSKTMRNEIAEVLERKERLSRVLLRERERYLLPKQYLDWIGHEKRQYQWLHYEIELMTSLSLSERLVHLTGRDRLIAMIDLWKTNLAEKASEVETLHNDWLRHKANDIKFEWFSDKKEGAKRCVCAWEWLDRNYSSMPSGQVPISNYQELMIFFDQENFSDIELTTIIGKIKSRWNRKQFDERTADKKQVNVMLSKSVITQLDKLAKKHNMKRAQIIEQLIAGESETEIHLSK